MITVTLFIQSDCEACQQAENDLQSLQDEAPHQLVVVNVDSEPALKKEYAGLVPIAEIGPYRLQSPFSRQDLAVALGAARDRHNLLENSTDDTYRKRLEKGHQLTKTDRFSFWLTRHYMLLFNLAVLIYVGLPFLAPTLMEAGATGPANILYKIYSPLCHQFAFRSWFLFGEQAAYPRELANVKGLIPYEQATGLSGFDVIASRNFLGNNVLGYKVALCERDIAIYGAILVFGLLYSITGHKLKSLPWYLWIAIGIIPIAVDGFSQLPDMMQLSWLSWLPMRESTPFLRSLTGFLFGFTTAWFGYPFVEESMQETRGLLTRKFAVLQHELSGNGERIN